MTTSKEEKPKEHIETIITKQKLSIEQLNEMKNQIVYARACTKKRLEVERKRRPKLEKKLEQATKDFEDRQKGILGIFKDCIEELKPQIFPLERIIVIFSFLGFLPTFHISYITAFLTLNMAYVVGLSLVFVLYCKRIYSKKENEYQEQISYLSHELECSRKHQSELEATLEAQLERVIEYLNVISHQESVYHENVAKRKSKLREERKKILASTDVQPTLFKQYIKIK